MRCSFGDFNCTHGRKCSGSTQTIGGNVSEWVCPELQKYRDKCQRQSSYNNQSCIDHGFLYFNITVIMAMIVAIFICRNYPAIVLLLVVSVILFTFNAIWMNRNLIKLHREIQQLRKLQRETEFALTIATKDRD